ncbi:MAG: TraB/GumN family protein [Rhizobium sp.]|nr:TraB/GumN family protein [Rhizobium sp.]
MSAAVTRFKDRFAPLTPDAIADRALGVLAALPFLLVLALLLAFFQAAPARAEDPACGGKDLLAELKATNPAEYARLRAEGDKIRNSGVRFWKLEKPGQEPNWLLGTMHLSDPRVTDLPAEAKAAFDTASVVVLESDEILDQQKAAARLMARPDLMYFAGKESIADYLKPEERKLLEDGFLKRGMPFAAISKMKPWILTSMVALPTCELSRKAQGVPFLDMKLARDGLAAGKEIKGVETLAEQMDVVASLPMSFHVKSLVGTVKYPQYTADMMETTLQLYLQGDIGLVFPAGAYFAPEKDLDDFKDMALFEEKLITLRNHTMADRGEPILARGNVFMAVGALHLIGDEGLVELLRKKGYTVTAVK